VIWRALRWALTAILAVAVVGVIIFQLKYRSWPLQAPHEVSWCEMGWKRGPRASDRVHQLYPVGRKPPVIGPEFYSPYTPQRRRQLSSGDMPDACGGELFARDGGRLVRYEVDPTVPH
jgi:hypothetical protein